MIDQDKLKTVLKALPIDKPEIDVVGTPPGLIATVTSDSFSTMNEGQRQALVWAYLQASLADANDLIQIEYVITNAPGDVPEELQAASK